MKTVHLVFFDAGGGHRSAANALREAITMQGRQWRVELLNLQELFDTIDPILKWTGVRMQDVYNNSLKRGLTFGWPQLTRVMQTGIRWFQPEQERVLREYWEKHPSDLVVSLIPNFNRGLFASVKAVMPKVPMLTVLTDLADYPPHFWMERQDQHVVCGTDRAVQQARALGYTDDRIFRTSGMIINPRFYAVPPMNRAAERKALGLKPNVPTACVLFGGHGSRYMEHIADALEASDIKVQLLMLCGHNARLADSLRRRKTRYPMHVEGFTREVPRFMQMADFFIGKPGPGSISEALTMKLPVIVQRNAWTLPQERYNTYWVQEKGFGVVVQDFHQVDQAIGRLLEPGNFKHFRARAEAYGNRAVFEVPEIMASLLEPQRASASASRKPRKSAVHAGAHTNGHANGHVNGTRGSHDIILPRSTGTGASPN